MIGCIMRDTSAKLVALVERVEMRAEFPAVGVRIQAKVIGGPWGTSSG